MDAFVCLPNAAAAARAARLRLRPTAGVGAVLGSIVGVVTHPILQIADCADQFGGFGNLEGV